VEKVLRKYPEIKSMHDFRIVGEGELKNLIFDIVLSSADSGNKKDQEKMLSSIKSSIKKEHPQYNCVITVDYDFM
ncbi:cation transporter, partial [Clostridium perfringens]|nr:cation transporter [Clostridium perfringens]